MKASNLTVFVDRENAFAKIFGRQPLSLQNPADRQKIADRIDSALSPENLTMDGECPPSEVDRRYRHLMGAAKELQRLDPTVRMYELS
jgi:hypothetical protein